MRKIKPECIEQGKVYHYVNGKAYRVGLLNDCRARLDPIFRKRRIIVDRLHDKTVIIHSKPPSLNVSPETKLLPVTVR